MGYYRTQRLVQLSTAGNTNVPTRTDHPDQRGQRFAWSISAIAVRPLGTRWSLRSKREGRAKGNSSATIGPLAPHLITAATNSTDPGKLRRHWVRAMAQRWYGRKDQQDDLDRRLRPRRRRLEPSPARNTVARAPGDEKPLFELPRRTAGSGRSTLHSRCAGASTNGDRPRGRRSTVDLTPITNRNGSP
jgi:hypothetical protein